MARTAKKIKYLTIEEKLQQALVQVDDQPYQVPSNWCWTHIKDLCNLINGRAFKPTDWSDTGLPIIRIQNLNNPDNEYNLYDGEVSDNHRLYGGELLFAWSGTPGTSFGAHVWYGGDAVLNQHIFRVDFDEQLINKKYFEMAINQRLDMLIAAAHGGAGLQHVTKGVFENTAIAFPPLLEQQRIVDRVESLFAKLEEAQEKAQAVVDGFEDRKAAILHKAFTGELTEKWRNENNVKIESWRRDSISSICHSLKYGTAKKSEKSGSVVVIRMGNLQQGEIDWGDLVYSNDADDIEKYHLEPNDVLFNRTNSAALVGKTSIYRGERPAIYAGYLIKLDYDHEIITGDFLNYALNTQGAKEYCNRVKTDGVNQSNINAKKIGAYIIPVPSIAEQNIIVDRLSRLLAQEKQVKESAEEVIDRIEVMKKAILSRAFRGELGTNNPSDESATELLKQILQEN